MSKPKPRKIRNHLLQHETMRIVFPKPTIVYFFGEIAGLVLIEDDGYIGFMQLSEDDGEWFLTNQNPTSAYWLQDYCDVFKAAIKWLNKHAVRDHGCWKVKV